MYRGSQEEMSCFSQGNILRSMFYGPETQKPEEASKTFLWVCTHWTNFISLPIAYWLHLCDESYQRVKQQLIHYNEPDNNKSRLAWQTLHLIQNQSWWCKGKSPAEERAVRLSSECYYICWVIPLNGFLWWNKGWCQYTFRHERALLWSGVLAIKCWTSLGWWFHCAFVLWHSQLI